VAKLVNWWIGGLVIGDWWIGDWWIGPKCRSGAAFLFQKSRPPAQVFLEKIAQ